MTRTAFLSLACASILAVATQAEFHNGLASLAAAVVFGVVTWITIDANPPTGGSA